MDDDRTRIRVYRDDDRARIGVYYFRVEGLPGSLNAYHAGVYHSYIGENGNRVTRTWDAGPAVRDPGLSGIVETAKELYAPSPHSPYGSIVVKEGREVDVGNEEALGNQIILPKGAIHGRELLVGRNLSGPADKINSTFEQIRNGNYPYFPGCKIQIQLPEQH